MWFCCLATLFLFNIKTACAVRPGASILAELNAEEEEESSGSLSECDFKSHGGLTDQLRQMAIAACARKRKWQISDRDEMACEMSEVKRAKSPEDCPKHKGGRAAELGDNDWLCLKPVECDQDDLEKHSLDELGNDIPLDTVWFWKD